MTRPTYGAAGGDYGFAVVNNYFRTNGGAAPAWDAETGGNRITDLQTLAGAATDVVAIPGDGSAVKVKLPDGYLGEVWVGPTAGPRVRLTPPSVLLASTTAPGVTEAAVDAEVTTGTDPLRYVSPATLATRLASFRTTLLGGAQAAWDTLQELKDLEDTNLGNLMTAIGNKISTSARGAANGVAPLDGSSAVPDANLPTRLSQASQDAAFVGGRACTITSFGGLPAPTGVGMEFVISAAGLDDIRFNGTSL